ncbi:MAG: hypothetical protein DSM106950_26600 [Stigonema ocellatum SAG 48.90 = DSM 106950]|nr:hypothetical protein [Stigonema ocellatum SAG 48.90 = DSM 106950]
MLVGFYVPPELKAKLETWAKSENRTVSNLVATFMTEVVRQKEANNCSSSSQTALDV